MNVYRRVSKHFKALQKTNSFIEPFPLIQTSFSFSLTISFSKYIMYVDPLSVYTGVGVLMLI